MNNIFLLLKLERRGRALCNTNAVFKQYRVQEVILYLYVRIIATINTRKMELSRDCIRWTDAFFNNIQLSCNAKSHNHESLARESTLFEQFTIRL